MSDHSHSTYPLLKDYGRFLLDNYLEEAAVEYIKISRAAELPLLNAFSHLNQEELLHLSRQILSDFFRQLAQSKAFDSSRQAIQQWKAGTHPLVSRSQVGVADLKLIYYTRKQLLLHFLPLYTKDSGTILSIVRELEEFYSRIEQLAISAYMDLRNEEQETYVKKLQEQKEELEAVNEELRASSDELQSTNEKLQEEILLRASAEKALEKEHILLKAVLNNISDGIVACDENGILSFFNNANREFHGLSEASLPPEKWASHYKLLHPDGKTPLKQE